MPLNAQFLRNSLPYGASLQEADLNLALDLFEEQQCRSGDYLLSEGYVCRYLYFIVHGLVYAHTTDGQILWYEFEGNSFTDPSSFYQQSPSSIMIRVAEDHTRLIRISRTALIALYQKSHLWALWGVQFQEKELLRITSFYESLRVKDATQRYEDLLQAYPEVLQRIPFGHIASYLGISQVSLSRIRAGTQKK